MRRKKIRTRLQPIRTASEITVRIVIPPVRRTPLYQKLAQKAGEIRLLGMSFQAIGRSLGVCEETARRACAFHKRTHHNPKREK